MPVQNSALMSVHVYFGVFYNSRNYAAPHFRAAGYNAILAFFLLGVDSRIASEFSLKLARCTPLSEACPVLSHGTHRPRPSCPSRSGARQATPRRFHSAAAAGLSHSARHRGAGAMFGSGHDRCLMGARQLGPFSLV